MCVKCEDCELWKPDPPIVDGTYTMGLCQFKVKSRIPDAFRCVKTDGGRDRDCALFVQKRPQCCETCAQFVVDGKAQYGICTTILDEPIKLPASMAVTLHNMHRTQGRDCIAYVKGKRRD